MTHAKQQRDTPQAVHYIIERSRPRRLPERPFEYVAEFVELSEEEYGAAGAPSDWPALKAAIEQANREGLPLVLDGIGHCYRSPRFLQVLSKADWIVCDRITKENIPTLIQEAAEIAGRIGSGVRAKAEKSDLPWGFGLEGSRRVDRVKGGRVSAERKKASVSEAYAGVRALLREYQQLCPHESLREWAERLNAAGMRSTRGGPIQVALVWRILKNMEAENGA